ncbi:hypothetical protein QE152_g10562 [Popillia japonica]|uniref:Uncharacterized protein n=1 Tax=Popillia japonica TaxID=7064 RepID=A0AAW1LV60_POPJA
METVRTIVGRALSMGSVMEQPQPSTSKTEELIPPPPHVRPLPDKSPVTRRTKFKETDETSNLSNTEPYLSHQRPKLKN